MLQNLVLKRMGNPMKLLRDWDRDLQLSLLNEEYPSKCGSSARVDYVPALCTHRPSLLPIGKIYRMLRTGTCFGLTALSCTGNKYNDDFPRGSKSRNKVSVGEPAEGSLSVDCSRPSIQTDNHKLALALGRRLPFTCYCHVLAVCSMLWFLIPTLDLNGGLTGTCCCKP